MERLRVEGWRWKWELKEHCVPEKYGLGVPAEQHPKSSTLSVCHIQVPGLFLPTGRQLLCLFVEEQAGCLPTATSGGAVCFVCASRGHTMNYCPLHHHCWGSCLAESSSSINICLSKVTFTDVHSVPLPPLTWYKWMGVSETETERNERFSDWETE